MHITFATNCWEKDWKYLLKKGYLERLINNCNYIFDKKILYISNVKNIDEVKKAAQNKIDQGVIDEYVFVNEKAKEVLDFFQININSFKGGYNYSISPLSAIFDCKSDLLLYFTGDAFIEKNDKNWLNINAKLLLENDNYFVANPLWNYKYLEAKSESMKENTTHFMGYGFSDQCFLVKIKDLRKPIYNEEHSESQRYPQYGGEPFEKRVDSYMRNHNLLRLTSKDTSYLHQNFPKETFFSKIDTQKKISIINLTHNSENLIENTLNSLINQKFLDFEYIVVDKLSEDKTLDKIKNYMPQFQKLGITVKILSEPNEGFYNGLDKGIHFAEGELIGVIHSGDWYEKETLSIVWDNFLNKKINQEDIIIYGNEYIKNTFNKLNHKKDYPNSSFFITKSINEKHRKEFYTTNILSFSDFFNFCLRKKIKIEKIDSIRININSNKTTQLNKKNYLKIIIKKLLKG